jgi:RND family efflux transporter MFP subunit
MLFISKDVGINSPIDGTVVAVNIHAGEVALPTTTAVEVMDLHRLVVAANIPAWQAAEFSIGRPAHIQIPAQPPQPAPVTLDGNVQRVDSSADPATNCVSTDISIPENANLRPGQLVQITIIAKEIPDALVVPADAIVRDSQDIPHVALVSDDHKQAILKRITPGLREGDWVQITGDGLAPNQTIVTGGAYGLLFRSDITVLNP